MIDFTDKKVLITGASSGIGAEFARQLAERGAYLILVARRQDLLLALQTELLRQGAKGVKVLPLNLVDEQELRELVQFVKNDSIDILINNAGRGSFGYFETIEIDDEVSQVKLNIIATMRLAQAVLPQMKLKRSGAIISVSSIAAFQPLPFMATYAATKSFNFMHSLALREELKPFGVKVLTLCPGPTATEFGGVARVPGTISGVARDNVQMVVQQTLKALGSNKAFVITGQRSWFMSVMSRLLPKSLTTAIVGRGLLKTLQQSLKLKMH